MIWKITIRWFFWLTFYFECFAFDVGSNKIAVIVHLCWGIHEREGDIYPPGEINSGAALISMHENGWSVKIEENETSRTKLWENVLNLAKKHSNAYSFHIACLLCQLLYCAHIKTIEFFGWHSIFNSLWKFEYNIPLTLRRGGCLVPQWWRVSKHFDGWTKILDNINKQKRRSWLGGETSENARTREIKNEYTDRISYTKWNETEPISIYLTADSNVSVFTLSVRALSFFLSPAMLFVRRMHSNARTHRIFCVHIFVLYRCACRARCSCCSGTDVMRCSALLCSAL